MHAIRQYEFGPPEVLRYEEVDEPRPGPGEVRIAVRAAGVHLVDTKIRAGEGPWQVSLPMTPGREVAGDGESVGPSVDEAWLGRRVVAHLGPSPAPNNGGYAEFAVAKAASLHALPDHVGYDAAVAMIGTGRTTMAILEGADLRADDVALVTAAAGGIGSLVVQAAAKAGATVVALAGSAEKVDLARTLGAHVAIDYRESDWPARVTEALGERAVTVVFDSVGGEAGRAALELLGPGGRLLLYGWSAGAPTRVTAEDIFERGITVSGVLGRVQQRKGNLRDLEEAALAALASGELTPVVASRYPLAKAAEAHAALETRGTMGKVVLIP